MGVVLREPMEDDDDDAPKAEVARQILAVQIPSDQTQVRDRIFWVRILWVRILVVPSALYSLHPSYHSPLAAGLR